MKNMHRKKLGQQGESKAKLFLKNKGLSIIAQNYRSPFGEIDLICKDGEQIVFVEVKNRQSLDYGDGSEAINARKQQRIIKTAYYYLKTRKQENYPFRFDVVSILTQENEQIKHISSAFP